MQEEVEGLKEEMVGLGWGGIDVMDLIMDSSEEGEEEEG